MSWCIPIFAAWFGDPGGVVPSAYQRWQLEARHFVQTSCLHIDLRFRCNCSRLYRGLTILGRQKCLPKTVSETVYQSHNSIGSNDGYLQTSLQSRHRATWHTIPLQAMVFWLACELLCVLPSLILLNLATNHHPFCLAHPSRCLIALFPPVAIVVVCKLVYNLGTERHGTLFPCKQWSSGWLASCYVCCQALFC